MTALTPPDRHIGRSRLVAVVAAVVGVCLFVSVAVWAVNRNTPRPSAGAAAGSPTPTATSPATPAAAKTPTSTATPKAGQPNAGRPKAGSTKATGKSTGPAPAWVKKLPAGIVEPGRKIVTPVDVEKTSVADSVRVDLTGFTAVTSKASGPGEISAPAVRLTIRLTNTGTRTLPLTSVVVNAYYGSAGTPGVLITGDPASKPFAGSLKPGAKATAVIVVNMPVSKRSEATITVSPSPTLPIAVFAGSLS